MRFLNGLPAYRNWGGPGWSIGRETNKLTEADKEVPAVDALVNIAQSATELPVTGGQT